MPTYSESDLQQAPAQHGQYSEADVLPEQSFGAAAEEYGRKMNPVSMAQGIAQNVYHPIDALKRWGDVNNRLLSNAEDAAKRGNYTEAAAHALHYVLNGIPGLGEALDEAGTKMRDGDIAGGLADTAALGTQIIAGAKAPAIASAAGKAATYTAAGAKAAAPGVLGGMAKAGAGEVLAKLPGMELPARFGLQYPALRQVAKAIEKGHEAGIKALGPKAAPSAASSAAGATSAPAAEEVAAEPTLAGGTTVQDIGKGLGIKNWKTATPEAKTTAQETFDRLKAAEQGQGAAPAAEAPRAYVPRTPADYGVKAAEVPPQPAPSAPAPTPASAAPTAKVQPIRPEPAYHATRSLESAEGILKKGTIYPAGDPGNETGFVSATTQPNKNYANAPVYFELDPAKTPLEPYDYFAGKPKTVNGETVPGYEGGPNDPRFEHEVRAQGAVPTSSVKAIHINPSVSAEDIQGLKASAAKAGIPVIEDSPAFGAKAPAPKPASQAPTAATAAKSARYADAISKWAKDMGMTPKDIADQWGTTTPEVRGQIMLELKRKGYLGANETIPKTSAPGIISALKAKAATIKPPAGFSMGSMKNQ